jgi:hypothetical protein
LIDVTVCRNSAYEILGEPDTSGGLYSRAFRVDDQGKAGLQALAARTGKCSTCTGEGSLIQGFRAQVYGKVIAMGSGSIPPLIQVLDATASHNNMPEAACASVENMPAQNPEFSGSAPASSSTNDSDDDNDTPKKVFMVLSLIAVAGVGILSIFGEQIFGTIAATTTPKTVGQPLAAENSKV